MSRAALEEELNASGLEPALETERATYPRFVSQADIDAWLSPSSAYGSSLVERLSAADVARIASSLSATVEGSPRRPLNWPLSLLFVKLRMPS